MEKLGNPTFGLEITSYEETIKKFNNLKSRNVQTTGVTVKIVKENIDIVYFLYNNFDNSLSSSNFPTGVKYVEVTHIYKKEDKTDKDHYCLVIILSNLSKNYERIKCIIKAIHIFIQYFPNFIVGFGNLLMDSIVF